MRTLKRYIGREVLLATLLIFVGLLTLFAFFAMLTTRLLALQPGGACAASACCAFACWRRLRPSIVSPPVWLPIFSGRWPGL